MINSTKGLEVGQKLLFSYYKTTAGESKVTYIDEAVLCVINLIYNEYTLCISPYENDKHELGTSIVLNVADLPHIYDENFPPSVPLGTTYHAKEIGLLTSA